jgi:hypothetical protein
MRSATACHCIPSWPTCYRFGGVSNALLKKKLTNKKKNLSLAKKVTAHGKKRNKKKMVG